MTEYSGEYNIIDIARKDGNTEDDEKRVGKDVIIDRINIGLPAIMVYKHNEGRALLTSMVVDKSESTDGVLTVNTMNTVYTLRRTIK